MRIFWRERLQIFVRSNNWQSIINAPYFRLPHLGATRKVARRDTLRKVLYLILSLAASITLAGCAITTSLKAQRMGDSTERATAIFVASAMPANDENVLPPLRWHSMLTKAQLLLPNMLRREGVVARSTGNPLPEGLPEPSRPTKFFLLTVAPGILHTRVPTRDLYMVKSVTSLEFLFTLSEPGSPTPIWRGTVKVESAPYAEIDKVNIEGVCASVVAQMKLDHVI
jgi:hypothetical protein